MKILESLALWKANGELRLLGLVDAQAPQISRGSLVVMIPHSHRREIIITTDYLTRRGLRPVVVMIDPASFDGDSGGNVIMKQLQASNVPECQITNGGDLQQTLSVLESR